MDLLDVARLLRFQTDWERRFSDYCRLIDAGLSESEAERIADLTAQDRAGQKEFAA